MTEKKSKRAEAPYSERAKPRVPSSQPAPYSERAKPRVKAGSPGSPVAHAEAPETPGPAKKTAAKKTAAKK